MGMDMNAEEPRRCPGCGYEYEPWVETCPDCGLPVQTPPPFNRSASGSEHGFFSPDEDPRWTVVFNAPDAMIANVLKSQLEDAGIPVLVQRSFAHFSASDYVPHELRVPARLLDIARQVLDSMPDYPDYVPSDEWPDRDDADTDADAGEAREEQWEDRPPAWPPSPSPPAGWFPLPAEQDEQAGHGFKRSRGEHAPGQYWSDERLRSYRREYDPYGGYGSVGNLPDVPYDDVPYEWGDHAGYSPHHRQWPESEDADAYEDDRWGRSAGWIGVVYGILLLAVSLPFILQLLQQIWYLLNGRP